MVRTDIREFVEREILPLYCDFDKAHGPDHAEKVIANSLEIAADYDVDMNMVYVIAAYHDIGLKFGRERHEKASAELLLADERLEKWFTAEERQRMAQAAEDHRASNDYEPRSLYGKIVSEADRDIEYLTILVRTTHYGLVHFPDYDYEQHCVRVREHLVEKYAEGGYLKLWLRTEKNERKLRELREIIASDEMYREVFAQVYTQCIAGQYIALQ